MFTGYVGPGLLDACASGDVSASPTADEMAEAMRAANGGAGVLRLYGNYGGDVMNFDMAGDLVEFDGIEATTVLLRDDVASAGLGERDKRRGVAGMVFAFKIAGAAAAAGLDLKAVTATRSGLPTRSHHGRGALGLHGAGRGQADLLGRRGRDGDRHGHPRRARGAAREAAAGQTIADQLLDPILADLSLGRGQRIAVLVNSLGATPAEELFILFDRIAQRCDDAGIFDRHDAGRPLRHLDGDGRRLAHGAAARCRARGVSRGARRPAPSGRSERCRSNATLRAGIAGIAAKLETEHAMLTELDGRLGDGDLGLTLLKAFRALDAAKDGLPADLGQALLQMGAATAKVSSSSFGTLLATGFMAVAKAVKGRRRRTRPELAALVQTAREAMQARGKAELGDKTSSMRLPRSRRPSPGAMIRRGSSRRPGRRSARRSGHSATVPTGSAGPASMASAASASTIRAWLPCG